MLVAMYEDRTNTWNTEASPKTTFSNKLACNSSSASPRQSYIVDKNKTLLL